MKHCCKLGLVVLVLLSSCGRKSAPERRLNLVLVTIDTLRADRLGCYGYSKIETPNLDRLAQKGVLFENAVAQAPLTTPSHASMMTGVYPTVHKVRDTGGFVLSSSRPTLASILQGQGWDTAAFVGSSVLKRRFGFAQGFGVYDDEMPKDDAGQSNRERRAGEVVDRAIRWLDSQSGKPFFLWVHVYDPHIPYDPPSPFREKYAGRPYDGEVAYTDQQLGRLFETVEKKSPAENTLIAVLSDHGESFSEHGEYAHGVFLYDTTLRIAFLMAGRGVPAGLRVKQQARTIDLLPTLLALAGGKPPQGVQGVSLAPAFTGKDVPTTWSYAETLFPKINMGWAELRGIRTNRWKYVRAPKPELYDLSQDPAEAANVIASHPAEAQELEAKLKAVIRSSGVGDSEKVETAPVDRRTLGELKSLGYLSGSSPGEYELTGKGADPKDRTDILKLLHFGAYADTGVPLPSRIGMLRRAIAKDPDNPALYSSLGDLYRDGGLRGEETALYQEAIHKGIRVPQLYSRLGALCLQQQNRQDAIAYFEAAARLNPLDYESLQNLAVAYRETGRAEDAERILLSIVKSGEPFAPAYNELGMVAFQRRDMTAAQAYFEKAAQLDPKFQVNLGRLYKMMGDSARARACFEAFLASNGTDEEYRRMVPQVKEELARLQ
jgi:choline-sulfatase